MVFFTIILTNESVNSNVQIPSVIIVKVEHVDVLVLFDSKDEICIAVDFSYTPPYTLSTNSILSKLQGDPPKYPYHPLYMRVAHHNTSSQHRALHTYPSSTIMSIGDALKLTKFRNRSKSGLASIDFDNMEM